MRDVAPLVPVFSDTFSATVLEDALCLLLSVLVAHDGVLIGLGLRDVALLVPVGPDAFLSGVLVGAIPPLLAVLMPRGPDADFGTIIRMVARMFFFSPLS